MKLRMFVSPSTNFITCHLATRLDAANAEIVCKTGRRIYREARVSGYRNFDIVVFDFFHTFLLAAILQ
jgi:hypothetical protein